MVLDGVFNASQKVLDGFIGLTIGFTRSSASFYSLGTNIKA